jgi:hypothetical protein
MAARYRQWQAARLSIPVQTNPLNLKFTRCQSHVASLVGLITIQQPAGNPSARSVETAFPGTVDARQGWTVSQGRERDNEALACDQVVLGSHLDDDPAMTGDVLVGLRRLSVNE